MKSVNFFINAPIELHILDALWTVFLGKMDNDKEELSIKGEVNKIEYINSKKDKQGGVLKKLLKICTVSKRILF